VGRKVQRLGHRLNRVIEQSRSDGQRDLVEPRALVRDAGLGVDRPRHFEPPCCERGTVARGDDAGIEVRRHRFTADRRDDGRRRRLEIEQLVNLPPFVRVVAEGLEIGRLREQSGRLERAFVDGPQAQDVAVDERGDARVGANAERRYLVAGRIVPAERGIDWLDADVERGEQRQRRIRDRAPQRLVRDRGDEVHGRRQAVPAQRSREQRALELELASLADEDDAERRCLRGGRHGLFEDG
jgi:hypothetical protein